MRIKMLGVFLVVVAASMVPLSARAAESDCKGMEKTVCEGNGRCSWVRSYTTSKGKTVSPYCRKKPERKKSNQAAAAPKT